MRTVRERDGESDVLSLIQHGPRAAAPLPGTRYSHSRLGDDTFGNWPAFKAEQVFPWENALA